MVYEMSRYIFKGLRILTPSTNKDRGLILLPSHLKAIFKVRMIDEELLKSSKDITGGITVFSRKKSII
jgi:hypothetical protein